MFGRRKKPAVSFTVKIDWADPEEKFKTIAEVNAYVLDLLQNGISLDDINVEDSNGKPYYLTGISFTA